MHPAVTRVLRLDQEPGEEIQWDWLELTDTPWGQPAYALVGALSLSGKFRAVLCEQMTFGHLAGALHEVLIGLGRTGRMVCSIEHTAQLERAVLDGFTTQPGCRRKVNRPPSDRALAELAARHGVQSADAPVVSLERYAQLAEAC